MECYGVNIYLTVLDEVIPLFASYFLLIFQQKFIEHDFLLENLSRETPIFIVLEGSEPQFFTRFFTWDSAKTAVSNYIKTV